MRILALHAGLGEPGGCLDAVESGHADVHQDDVGVQAACLGQCLAAVAGLAGDGRSGSASSSIRRPSRIEVLVVGDQDADHDRRAGAAIGSRAQTVNPPPGRGPAAQVTAEHRDPLAHPGQSRARRPVPGAPGSRFRRR